MASAVQPDLNFSQILKPKPHSPAAFGYAAPLWMISEET